MYDYVGNNWSHWNSNKNLKKNLARGWKDKTYTHYVDVKISRITISCKNE